MTTRFTSTGLVHVLDDAGHRSPDRRDPRDGIAGRVEQALAKLGPLGTNELAVYLGIDNPQRIQNALCYLVRHKRVLRTARVATVWSKVEP